MTSEAPARHVLDPTGQDVYGEIDRLRADGPVVRVEMPGGLPAWVVLGYGEAVELLKVRNKDPLVSKDIAYWADFLAGLVPNDWPLLMWAVRAGMFTADPPRHRDLRSWAAPAFTPRRIKRLAPVVEQIVADRLAALAPPASGGQVVDLRAEFCLPVPIEAIGALLGVPDDLAGTFRAGADALFDTTVTPEDAQARFVALLGAIETMVDRKIAEPGVDLTSDMVKTLGTKEAYTREVLLETVRLTIVAGYETTGNLIDQTVFALQTHPEHRAAVLAGEISWDAVVDETLRWAGIAANLPLRFAVKDFELGGARIHAGDAILVNYAGAGRDPAKFERPEVFDPTRASREHLGFGHGTHYCLGAPLAVLEAKAALPALFDRFPDLSLAEDPDTIPANPGFITNGHARLPVHLAAPRA
ncbi:cytochrome P450 [Promicromonospora sp. AC04]|uniref:cytochrome P450 family protein n=1 Tax=Promicromonospora sp. AC04 TaxID=2135723 RepID=UPI000D355BC3|nr:cytochrome P450 [Promicromonospora sp. AC04]PUB32569.1 cytochrome P450 [Promicromonospora sp. AC04]